jgi:hypothetical protein
MRLVNRTPGVRLIIVRDSLVATDAALHILRWSFSLLIPSSFLVGMIKSVPLGAKILGFGTVAYAVLYTSGSLIIIALDPFIKPFWKKVGPLLIRYPFSPSNIGTVE